MYILYKEELYAGRFMCAIFLFVFYQCVLLIIVYFFTIPLRVNKSMEECSLKYLIDNQRKCSEEQYNEEYTYFKGHFYCVEN